MLINDNVLISGTGCTGNVVIPDNVTEIDYEAFKDIRAKEFDLMDNENFFVKDGMYIDKKNDCVYATNEECSGDILIPDYIEKIYLLDA